MRLPGKWLLTIVATKFNSSQTFEQFTLLTNPSPILLQHFQIRVPNWLRVALFIERFELAAPNQCSQNFLEIYAGGTAREPLKRYCGIIATHTYTSSSVVFVRLFVASQFHAINTKLRVLFSSYLARKFWNIFW